MAKVNLLAGFKFQKLPEISNGLIIPTGNEIHAPQNTVIPETIIPTFVEPKPPPKHRIPKPSVAENRDYFGKIALDSSAFTPMTNIVPTIEDVAVPDEKLKFKGLSRRAKQIATPQEIDLLEYGALQTKQERISYLAIRGWSLKIEQRGNGLYYYATKYFERKKKRIYVCSINQGM